MWLTQRVHDIITDAYPKERLLCILSFSIRLAFILAPALATWELLPPLAPFPLITRIIASYVAAFAGAFVYADLGLEEGLRKLTMGYSYNPNCWPLGTLEGFCGSIDTETQAEWQRLKMTPLRPWDGTPGSGKFGAE